MTLTESEREFYRQTRADRDELVLMVSKALPKYATRITGAELDRVTDEFERGIDRCIKRAFESGTVKSWTNKFSRWVRGLWQN